MRIIYAVANAILILTLAGCASTETDLDVGLWHYKAGLYAQAAPRLLKSVPAIEATDPTDPRLVVGYLALGHMATTYKAPPNEVEVYYVKALNTARRFHAADSTLSRNVVSEMGNFYLAQEKHAMALPFLLQASQISENDQSISRILYAIDLDNVAVAHSGLHNYGIALQYSDNALKQLANLPDGIETRASQGIVLFNRAFAYAEQGLLAQADDSYRRSLQLMQTNGESWRRRVVVTNYAKLLRSQQRELDAQEVERRYLE